MLKDLPTSDKTEFVISVVRLTIRLTLILSIFLILVSSLLRLLCGAVTFESYNLVYGSMPWYSVLISIWTITCSVPALIVVLFYNRRGKAKRWPEIKNEITLLGVSTISVLLFILIIKN